MSFDVILIVSLYIACELIANTTASKPVALPGGITVPAAVFIYALMFTELPPSWEACVDQARVAEMVRGADSILVVHRCIRHDGTDALKAVVKRT